MTKLRYELEAFKPQFTTLTAEELTLLLGLDAIDERWLLIVELIDDLARELVATKDDLALLTLDDVRGVDELLFASELGADALLLLLVAVDVREELEFAVLAQTEPITTGTSALFAPLVP